MSNPFDIFDIVWYIYKFIPYNEKNGVKYVNKYLYELWIKQTNNVIKIQRCIRKNNLLNYLDREINYIPMNVNNSRNKNLIYRYYILKYPMEFLLIYPEFLLNKAIHNLERKNEISQWIENNLNKDTNKRTRHDILKFFKINNISSYEIAYSGW
jgi:hypothetical protein